MEAISNQADKPEKWFYRLQWDLLLDIFNNGRGWIQKTQILKFSKKKDVLIIEFSAYPRSSASYPLEPPSDQEKLLMVECIE